MQKLAVILKDRDQHRAVSLALTAFKGLEANNGGTHPYTLRGKSRLARCLEARNETGDRKLAIGLLTGVIKEQELKYYGNHPETFESMHWLAWCLSRDTLIARQQEAIDLYKDVVVKREQNEGLAHPNTLSSMFDLAMCYWRSSNNREARYLMLETHKRSSEKWGVNHTITKDTWRQITQWEKVSEKT
jgi:hypothetical protein